MRPTLPAAIASLLLAALPASAELYGGTERDTIAVGGSLFYDTGSANGKDLSLEAHAGYYVLDAFLLGGSFGARNDDVADTYEMGVRSAELLLERIRGKEPGPARCIELKNVLTERGSTQIR